MNISEAIPGVPTPLTWTFFAEAFEYGISGGFADLGLTTRTGRSGAPSLDERFTAIFLGRPAVNLDRFRLMADRTPGGSGDALEEQFFGSVRTRGRPEVNAGRGRYPIIALKASTTTIALPRRLHRTTREVEQWWQRSVASVPADEFAARALFAEALVRLGPVFRLHLSGSMIAQGLFDQLRRAAKAAGDPGLPTRLVTGYPSLIELDLLADLWRVSRGDLSVRTVVATHGYHGPLEGELASPSWREDPSELEGAIERFRERDDDESPQSVLRRQTHQRLEAERALLAGTARIQRPLVHGLLRLAFRYIPYREVGKATFLRVVDVARAAARALGQQAAAKAILRDADDIFYLTVDEILGPWDERAKDAVAWRRRRRQEHLALELPDAWVGRPEPLQPKGPRSAGAVLRGLPVSGGVLEGRARVVCDPSDRPELLPGEILVCHTTDPSWTPLFFLASAVVIDVGGPLSHGAIVARELGIPCIINTREGTSTVKTGDLLKVDGQAGTAEILQQV